MNNRVALAAMALLLAVAATPDALAIVPLDAGWISYSPMPINTSPGEQYDPNVDQDFVTYSELVGFDQLLHYYQFSSGVDRTIPRSLPGGLFAQDFLAGVQGGHIVFNRYLPTTGATTTMLFDTVTGALKEINPQPGSLRYGTSIGGSTVAYADMGVVDPAQQIGEIYVWDTVTSRALRLTNDLLYDDSPRVSPFGDVVTWESCVQPFTNCNIRFARHVGPDWPITTISNSPASLMAPDTDGTYVVWEANAGDANGWDVYFMPVGGTVPQRIELADDQYHPRIAGGVIIFESQNPTTLRSDLLIYEIASNRLFRLTNTPTIDETLVGITRLPSGAVRVVWQANDDMSTVIPSDNIYGATLALGYLLPRCPPVPFTAAVVPCSNSTPTSLTGLSTGIGTVDIYLAANASFAEMPAVNPGAPIVPGLEFLFGTISYTAHLPVDLVAPGGSVTTTFVFTPPLPQGLVLQKVNSAGVAQPIDPALWSRTDSATSTTVTLILQDGGAYDLDGVANGRVVDPVAFGILLNQLPVANAGPDQNIYLGQTAMLDGSASSDPYYLPLTYSWVLDSAPVGSAAVLVGASSKTPSLTPDMVGSYHVSLVVNDGKVDSAASPVLINVSLNLPPVAIASGTPLSGDAPLSVTFDASGSHDPEHSALKYAWDFGDPDSGTSNVSAAVKPAHTYLYPGAYTAVVTVSDDLGKTDQASVALTVTAPHLPPAVRPTATPNSGSAYLDVQFAANATDANPGEILAYLWDFGDPASGAGNASTLANPVHTYSSPGTYTATVSVTPGAYPPVVARVTISVSSALVIHVTEAKVERGERGKVEGRISMKADFGYSGAPLAPADVIRVVFGGITLLEVPYGSFSEDGPGRLEYESRTLEAGIDFNLNTIRVSRHKILTNGVDNSHGIDVAISFGAATANDHFLMTGRKDDQDSDLSHKEESK